MKMKYRKMRLSPEDVQAIIDSIGHWYHDVLEYFEDGYIVRKGISGTLYWALLVDGRPVNYGKHLQISAKNCSLCQKYDSCGGCPWFQESAYKRCSERGQEYDGFINAPTANKAHQVLNKLWNIGVNYSKLQSLDFKQATYYFYER